MPTYLTDVISANQDFGSILLFGAYMGLFYRFDCGLKVGYRLQHISNGHIFYEKVHPTRASISI